MVSTPFDTVLGSEHTLPFKSLGNVFFVVFLRKAQFFSMKIKIKLIRNTVSTLSMGKLLFTLTILAGNG